MCGLFDVQVFSSLKDANKSAEYLAFLDRYKRLDSANDRMKSAMTDVAFEMTKRVWQDLPTERRGNCFFCIGGVNAINPFSATAVKNEIVVYVGAIPKEAKELDPKEGTFYDMSGNSMRHFNLEGYDEIYMDFNGSMAFFNDDWQKRLGEPDVVKKASTMTLLLTRHFRQSSDSRVSDQGSLRYGGRASGRSTADDAVDSECAQSLQQVFWTKLPKCINFLHWT
jgi:hypothetical protein